MLTESGGVMAGAVSASVHSMGAVPCHMAIILAFVTPCGHEVIKYPAARPQGEDALGCPQLIPDLQRDRDDPMACGVVLLDLLPWNEGRLEIRPGDVAAPRVLPPHCFGEIGRRYVRRDIVYDDPRRLQCGGGRICRPLTLNP